MWKGVCHREHRMFSELQVAQCGLSTGYMRTSDGRWSRKITRATFAVLRDLNFGLWDMGYTTEFQAGDWCDQNCPLEKLITLECWRPVVGEWEWTHKLVRKLLVRNQLGRNKLRRNKWFHFSEEVSDSTRAFLGGQRGYTIFQRGEILFTTMPSEWLLLNKGSLDLPHADQFGYAKVDWSWFLERKLESRIFCA